MNAGWIKLHRQFANHWLWRESRKFSKAEAWLDLIMKANHANNKSVKGMSVIEIKRGQVLSSQIKLAERWKWNPKTVKRYIVLLKDDGMIEFKTDSGGDSGYTLITLLNYDKFQGGKDNGTDTGAADKGLTEGERVPTNKNDKKNENKEEKERNFKEIWLRYPRKIGEKPAEKLFQASVRSQENWKSINKALDNYLNAKRVKGGYIKDGATWFKEWKEWIDYVETKGIVGLQEKEISSLTSEEFEKAEEKRHAEAREFFGLNKS